MAKFVPKKPNKNTQIIPIALRDEMCEALDHLRKQIGITRLELIRQMIEHCLQNFDVDFQPTERKKRNEDPEESRF